MPTATGDQALIKRINTALLLDAIIRHAPLSRAQLSAMTGLNKATVSSLVLNLIDSHLVEEIGHGESSGGRKPVMLQFIPSAGYAIGIDLGVNYIRGVLTDLRGGIAGVCTRSLHTAEPDVVLQELIGAIDALCQEAPQSIYGIVGIGVGVPGLVDDQGNVLFAPNLHWRDVPLRRMLAEHFKLPVTIDNEANTGALGEQKYGVGRQIDNMIYVSAGVGIGTGLILNKQLYKGTSGFSGEMGHLSIEASGPACSCGNRGCWELYASERALLEQAKAIGLGDLDSLLEAAEAGREDAQALFAQIGEKLGVGLVNIVNVFNPDAVIIGNRLSKARKWLESSVRQTVVERTIGFHLRNVQLLFAELDEQSATMGAAELAIAHYFAQLKASL